MTYKVTYDATGQPVGLITSDGASVPIDSRNADFRTFLAWNAAQQVPLDYSTPGPKSRVSRSMLAIVTDLNALSGANQTAIWNAFNAGNPPLWSTDTGLQAPALSAHQLIGSSTVIESAIALAAKFRAVACYCIDNPKWLVSPAFAPSVNVPGDQPA